MADASPSRGVKQRDCRAEDGAWGWRGWKPPSGCFALRPITMQGQVILGDLRPCDGIRGTLAQGLPLVRACFFPKLPSDLDRIDPRTPPPGSFVACAMRGAVMCSTEWDREFIARLAAERAWLHELQVVRVGRFAAAQEARLLGHEPQVLLVAVAARRAQREDTLVDPTGLMPFGAAGWSERCSSRIYIG